MKISPHRGRKLTWKYHNGRPRTYRAAIVVARPVALPTRVGDVQCGRTCAIFAGEFFSMSSFPALFVDAYTAGAQTLLGWLPFPRTVVFILIPGSSFLQDMATADSVVADPLEFTLQFGIGYLTVPFSSM